MVTRIISLGGSLVAPDEVDVNFISDFFTLITEYLDFESNKFVFVIGGGATARSYQQAYKDYISLTGEEWDNTTHNEIQDIIGIKATHLNAAFIREVFGAYSEKELITDPEAQDISFDRPVLIGAGWKPGFSTDLCTVKLAIRFNVNTIINLSNVAKIYSEDPLYNSAAQELDTVTWKELIAMFDDTWKPGMNTPFDPIACRLASEADLQVINTYGRDMDNLKNIFDGKEYYGTTITNK